MIRDIAAAVGRMKFNIHLLQQAAGNSQMFALSVATQRNNVRMLAKEQHVRDRMGLSRLHQPPLQITRGRVGHSP
jgi:hypothetical protein